ncbi:MAG: YraN family protein [Candidatus Limnocylindria bacterium]
MRAALPDNRAVRAPCDRRGTSHTPSLRGNAIANRRHALGARAEAAVARWLSSAGWTILDRRWRTSSGELDLVCLDTSARLVGVEVRLRTSGRAGSPLESITARHRSRLRAAVVAYALENRLRHAGLRVDLVAVTPSRDAWHVVRHAGIDAW